MKFGGEISPTPTAIIGQLPQRLAFVTFYSILFYIAYNKRGCCLF